ncbi:MAG: serine/threonine-protein kinase [Planctomycetota bacterium]
MTDDDPRDSSATSGRMRALVDAAWRQAEALRQAEHEAGSAAGWPGDAPFAGPSPDSFTGYKILRELHRGGQGVVYQAIQESTQRKVAIKVMREGPFAGPADRARFDREVHVLGQLNHPHIVAIHDTGSAAGHLYFVMDYIPGQPLDIYMAGGDHTMDETLRLFGKICEAVNAAHLRGVIHRDLKPSNIRIDPDGAPHILDFGLAKVATPLSGEGGAASMTLTGQFVGSLPWASPEQAEGTPAKIDVRTDVYALGVILYQMLTGRFPYEVIGPMRDVLNNILTAEPVRPSAIGWHDLPGRRRGRPTGRINDEIDTIVLKCLSKERERRYQTAGELARDIAHYLAGEPIEAKRDSAGYVLRKQLKRHRIPVAVAGAFTLVLTLGLVFSLVSWQTALYERDHATEVTRFMQQMLSGINPDVARGLDTALMRMVLDDAAKHIEQELREQPVMEASLRKIIGATYVAIGEYTLAEPHLVKALQIRDQQLGGEHEDTLTSMHDLAALRYEQGRFDEALDGLETTLERRREILGAEDPATLRTMTELGWFLVRAQRYDEAEALLSQALEAQRRLLGSEHPDTLDSMNDLGLFFYYACLDYVRYGHQEYLQSEQLLRQVLEVRRASLGDDHLRTLYAMNNLSLPLAAQGKLDEAASLLRHTLDTRQRLLGARHTLTLGTLGNLAELHRNWGKWAEAESLYRNALDGYRELLGDEHPDTLTCMNNLALVLQSLQEYEPAVELLKQTIEKRTRVLGAAHAYTLGSMFHLAWTYYLANMPARAEPVLRQVLAGYEQTLGGEEPLTLLCMYKLALVLQALQRYNEAEEFFLRSIKGRKKVLGESHEYTLGTMAKLGWMYLEWGKPELADPVLQSTVELAQAALPAGDYRTATCRSARGACLTKLERWAEAEAQLLASQGDLAAWNNSHPDAGHATQLLVELYDAWHAAEPGQGHDAQAARWRAKLQAWQTSTQPAATQGTAASGPLAPTAGLR